MSTDELVLEYEQENKAELEIRRTLDRRLLANHDKVQKQLQDILIRITRNEALFEIIKKDNERIAELQQAMTVHLEVMATTISDTTQKLAVHMVMEEAQQRITTQINNQVEYVIKELNTHLSKSQEVESVLNIAIEKLSVRLNWHERYLNFLAGLAVVAAGDVIVLSVKVIASKFGIN